MYFPTEADLAAAARTALAAVPRELDIVLAGIQQKLGRGLESDVIEAAFQTTGKDIMSGMMDGMTDAHEFIGLFEHLSAEFEAMSAVMGPEWAEAMGPAFRQALDMILAAGGDEVKKFFQELEIDASDLFSDLEKSEFTKAWQETFGDAEEAIENLGLSLSDFGQGMDAWQNNAYSSARALEVMELKSTTLSLAMKGLKKDSQQFLDLKAELAEITFQTNVYEIYAEIEAMRAQGAGLADIALKWEDLNVLIEANSDALDNVRGLGKQRSQMRGKTSSRNHKIFHTSLKRSALRP